MGMCCPPVILLAGAAPPTATRCQLLHSSSPIVILVRCRPAVLLAGAAPPTSRCLLLHIMCHTAPSPTMKFTCCPLVVMLAGAAPPTEKQVSAAARHLLRSRLPTIDAQASDPIEQLSFKQQQLLAFLPTSCWQRCCL
jgi:hypothetical protein